MMKNSSLCIDGYTNQSWFLPLPELAAPWNYPDNDDRDYAMSSQGSQLLYPAFASIRMELSSGNRPFVKHVAREVDRDMFTLAEESVAVEGDAAKEEIEAEKAAKKKRKFKIKIKNPHLRRLFSGGIAGAVSRTVVAPLETIRTHLMVGSNGNSATEVFHSIMETEGWSGLFRGNFVNVIRVTPSKAIELFAFDSVKKALASSPKLPVPSALIAGAIAGVSSTLCTYPLELIKTRMTIQRGVYDNFLHAFAKIIREEGPGELYRGLTPSVIGIIPYAAINYYTYDTLKKLYKKKMNKEEVSNLATLLIGSASAAISSSATFPLEVARKQMQVGAVGGRQVYKSLLEALLSIVEKEGVAGLYKGLGPSCLKLVPAAGISFMCYEACKKILVEDGDDADE